MKRALSICLLASAGAALAGCHSSEPVRPGTAQTVQARVVESREQQTPVAVRATGTLHARQTAVISAQVIGRVQEVLVREGDPVRAGQTIAVLDDATLRAAVDQAQAAVKAAENQQAAAQTNADLAASTLGRYKQLQAQKSVSPQELDEVTRPSGRLCSAGRRGSRPGCRRQGPGKRRPRHAGLYTDYGAVRRSCHCTDGRPGSAGFTRRAASSN